MLPLFVLSCTAVAQLLTSLMLQFCAAVFSSTVHLLAAHRPKSRRSSCTGDRTHVQDGQGSVQSAGEGLDAQVRHVARSVRPLAHTLLHQLLLAVSIVFLWSTHSLLSLVRCAC